MLADADYTGPQTEFKKGPQSICGEKSTLSHFEPKILLPGEIYHTQLF